MSMVLEIIPTSALPQLIATRRIDCLKLECDYYFCRTGSDPIPKRVSARLVSEMLEALAKDS